MRYPFKYVVTLMPFDPEVRDYICKKYPNFSIDGGLGLSLHNLPEPFVLEVIKRLNAEFKYTIFTVRKTIMTTATEVWAKQFIYGKVVDRTMTKRAW